MKKRNHSNWSCNFILPVASYKGHHFAYSRIWGFFYWVEEAMIEFDNGTFLDWSEIKRPDDITEAEEKKLIKKYII